MVSTHKPTKYKTPGVYKEEVIPALSQPFLTGVPAFLGRVSNEGNPQFNQPQPLRHWSQFQPLFGASVTEGYLADAVRGFFLNGGQLCYVVPLQTTPSPKENLERGLKAIEDFDVIDLVCAPDVMQTPKEATTLQNLVLDHCENRTGDRFAILDSLNTTRTTDLEKQREQLLQANNGALYYPWIKDLTSDRFIPPCGHIAGVYARIDRQTGVYKAPANAVIEGILDLSDQISNSEQGPLNEQGINCLRVFPGRGIRIWGARTLSHDPNWTYISTRRLFLTAGRWIERNLSEAVFATNDANLWGWIRRELTVYFSGLYQQGALKGESAEEAFYIKCDAETNPPDLRETGKVATEIGLASAIPSEFVVVRMILGAGGITIAGPI